MARWAGAAEWRQRRWVAYVLMCAFTSIFVTAAAGPHPTSGHGSVTFPRTAAFFLQQEDLPPADVLARYDVVVIDNEWAHRKGASFFADLRRLNPHIVLLAYVIGIDRPERLGTQEYYANRYRLWDFIDGNSSNFPQEWMARTANGTTLSEYPDTLMTNLADTAPAVGGQRFYQRFADWVVDTVYASGVWDGIYLDTWGDRVYSADHATWDVDGNGTDEPDTEIYGAGNPWERGLSAAERLMRARMPGAILVANGDRTMRDGQLNGRVWEDFADPTADRGKYDLRGYLDFERQGGYRSPVMAITIDRRSQGGPLAPEDFRRARFFLTATLLGDGYWAPAGAGSSSYGELPDYGALTEPGYLGEACGPAPDWDRLQEPFHDGVGTTAMGVYRRDFAHGVVLHNAGEQAMMVGLGGQYLPMPDDAGPPPADQRPVSTVTVPAHDGLILLSVND